MLESYEDIEIRDFQHLDTDGRFIVFPEYPEFACVEGIVKWTILMSSPSS